MRGKGPNIWLVAAAAGSILIVGGCAAPAESVAPAPPATELLTEVVVTVQPLEMPEIPPAVGEQAELPPPEFSRSDVVWIQQRLQELGYYSGAVDGAPGNATQQAIRDYQVDQGLAADGRPTAELREFMWRNGG